MRPPPLKRSTKDQAVRIYLADRRRTIEDMAEICDVSTRSFSSWVADFRRRHPQEAAELADLPDRAVLERLRELVDVDAREPDPA